MDPSVVLIILVVLILLTIIGDFVHKKYYGKEPNQIITLLYTLDDKAMNVLDKVLNNSDLQDINSYDEFRAEIIYSTEMTFKEELINFTNESKDKILAKYNLTDAKLDEAISTFISELINKNDYETIIKKTYDHFIKKMNE